MNERAMKSGLWSVLVLLCHLTLAGCRPHLPLSVVSGSVTFDRTEVGVGTSEFGDCRAGIREHFNGADLAGNNGFLMRVLRSESKQPILVLSQEPNKNVELTAATCSVLDVYVFRGWGEIEKLQPGERLIHAENLERDLFISGSALFDCQTPAGGRARGSLSFRCGW